MQAIKKTVIVEVVEENNTTESGLILQTAQERNPTATIISVGPKVDCELKQGDRVLVDWSRVGKFTADNRTYYVTDQSNILGVFVE